MSLNFIFSKQRTIKAPLKKKGKTEFESILLAYYHGQFIYISLINATKPSKNQILLLNEIDISCPVFDINHLLRKQSDMERKKYLNFIKFYNFSLSTRTLRMW